MGVGNPWGPAQLWGILGDQPSSGESLGTSPAPRGSPLASLSPGPVQLLRGAGKMSRTHHSPSCQARWAAGLDTAAPNVGGGNRGWLRAQHVASLT